MKRTIRRPSPGKDFQDQLKQVRREAWDEAFADATTECLNREARTRRTHEKQIKELEKQQANKIQALIKKNRALQTKLTTACWKDTRSLSLAAQAANGVLVDQMICLGIEIEMLVKLVLHMKHGFIGNTTQEQLETYEEVTRIWRMVHDINQPALEWADGIRQERIDAEAVGQEKSEAELPTETFAERGEADRAEAGQEKANQALRGEDRNTGG